MTLGNEPEFKGNIAEPDFRKALQWYSEKRDSSDSKRWTLEWLDIHNPTQASKLRKLKEGRFGILGWLARLQMRGVTLPERSSEWFRKQLAELETKTYDAEDKPRASVKDYIVAQLPELIGGLDGILDSTSGVDVYKWMQDNGVKAPHARLIYEHYEPLQKELMAVLHAKNPDQELKEYYESISRERIIAQLNLVRSIRDNCVLIEKNAKITRRPRKKKVKSAEKLVAKAKYLEKDDTLKLVSVPIEKLVGAEQLWVFNVKTRKLGVYHAIVSNTLSIKGTTIQMFDEKASIQKTVRKPEKILPGLVDAGKVQLRKVMDNIKAKPAKLTGRLNSDILLLRIV